MNAVTVCATPACGVPFTGRSVVNRNGALVPVATGGEKKALRRQCRLGVPPWHGTL